MDTLIFVFQLKSVFSWQFSVAETSAIFSKVTMDTVNWPFGSGRGYFHGGLAVGTSKAWLDFKSNKCWATTLENIWVFERKSKVQAYIPENAGSPRERATTTPKEHFGKNHPIIELRIQANAPLTASRGQYRASLKLDNKSSCFSQITFGF